MIDAEPNRRWRPSTEIFIAISLALVVALALGACGGDGEGDPGAIVGDYYAALADHDGAAACAHLTGEMQRTVVEQAASLPGYSGTCPDAVEVIVANLGGDEVSALRNAEITDTAIDGDTATVTIKDATSVATLKKVDGRWYLAGGLFEDSDPTTATGPAANGSGQAGDQTTGNDDPSSSSNSGAASVGVGKTLKFADQWNVSVLSTRIVDDIPNLGDVVSGHFAVVKIRVVNRTSRTEDLNLGFAYRLVTTDGSSYEPSTDGTIAGDFESEMPPNVPKVQPVAFEIPPGATPASILVAPTPDGSEYGFLTDADYGEIKLR